MLQRQHGTQQNGHNNLVNEEAQVLTSSFSSSLLQKVFELMSHEVRLQQLWDSHRHSGHIKLRL